MYECAAYYFDLYSYIFLTDIFQSHAMRGIFFTS